MNPLQFFIILRARCKIALILFFLTVVAGLGITLLMPKYYLSTTAVVFDAKQDPIAGFSPAVFGYMATQLEIIKSDRVAQKVVRILRLNENPGLKQQWLEAAEGKNTLELWIGEQLARGLIVTPVPGSNIFNISYRATDPVFATHTANAFAQAYIETNIELKVDPAKQYTRWFEEQGKTMRENLEKAQARLSEFQQQKTIVARIEQADIETIKLNDLSAQLTAIQASTASFGSKQKSGADTLPEVMGNSMIVGLKNQISQLEIKLQEDAGNLGKNHPYYQRMEVELAALKRQLEATTRQVTSSFDASRSVGKDQESNLRAAIAAQKKKLLELRSERDQLAVLQRDVDAAQAAYDGVTKRYMQSSLESQVTQTNASVLSKANEPIEPYSPKMIKNLAMSLLFGILLGCGAAFLLELLDRRIRSAADLSEMLQLPVLAVIERPRQPRLAFRRRPALPAPR